MVRFTLRIPDELKSHVRILANKYGVKLNTMFIDLIEAGLALELSNNIIIEKKRGKK